MYLLLKMVIFQCHVSFQGCTGVPPQRKQRISNHPNQPGGDVPRFGESLPVQGHKMAQGCGESQLHGNFGIPHHFFDWENGSSRLLMQARQY